jgi:hypothetical protein
MFMLSALMKTKGTQAIDMQQREATGALSDRSEEEQ